MAKRAEILDALIHSKMCSGDLHPWAKFFLFYSNSNLYIQAQAQGILGPYRLESWNYTGVFYMV